MAAAPRGRAAARPNIKDDLAAFRAKLAADTVTTEDCDKLFKIFDTIQKDAATFREQAGTAAMRDQMKPWLDTWDDLTKAAITELGAVKASLAPEQRGADCQVCRGRLAA